MRRLWLLLLVPIIAAPVRAQQEYDVSHRVDPTPPSLRLIIAPHVTRELDALADTLRVETVRCLIGVVRGTRAVIDLAWTPPIGASEPHRVEYQSCPSATLALWHNHPSFSGEEPEYACYLSATDILEALRPLAPPIQMVQVTGTVACWWTRRELSRLGQLPILFPGPRQRWGRQLDLDEARCRGELRYLMACTLLLSCDHGTEACRPAQSQNEVATLGRESTVPPPPGPLCRDVRSKSDLGSRTDTGCAPPRP